MKTIKIVSYMICILILISQHVIAQTTVTFKPGPSGGKDATLDSYPSFAGNNYGTTEAFEFGAATDGGTPYSIRDLLQFDLSSIPTGKFVVSAFLTLYFRGANPSNLSGTGHYNFNDNASYIERVIAPWDESTVTWNNQPGTDSTGRLTIPATGSDTASLFSFNMTSFVQQWVSNPTLNYGMLFKVVSESPYRAVKYYSSDAPNTAVRPRLVVTYSNCPVPSATVTPGNNVSICSGSDVLLVASASSIASYQWRKNGVNIQGATSNSWKASIAGTYKCIVTNVCGNTATSNAVTLTKLPLASVTVSAGGPTTFCAGNFVTLNASNPGAGYTYQWYRNNIAINGATGLSYASYNAGIIKIAIMNTSNGCSRFSNAITVSINCRTTDQDQNISVFPNPCNGVFSIELNDRIAGIGVAEIKLFDMLGQLVFYSQEELNNDYFKSEINIGKSLNKGIYFLKVRFPKEKIYDTKLIIQ